MKRIKNSAELLWLLGIIFIAFGVAVCSKADLGVSMMAAPTFVINEALVGAGIKISIGTTEYIIQGLVIALVCVLIRKFRWNYLLSFVVAVIHGSLIDLFLLLLGGISISAAWQSWFLLILGDVIIAFGVAALFRTYLPLGAWEFFVAALSKVYRLKIKKVKMTLDVSLLAISVALALVLFGDVASFNWADISHTSFHSMGLGTIVTTFINAPLITLAGKVIDLFFDPSPKFSPIEKRMNK
jgi:uncharacterized membrane protein YczE